MLIEQYKHGFGTAQMVLMANLQGVTHMESISAVGEAGNCINWIAGHLLSSRAAVLEALGEQSSYLTSEEAQPYLQGSGPLTQEEACQGLERLIDGLQATHDKVMSRLAVLKDSDLLTELDPSVFPMPVEHPILATLMTTLLFHEAYHIGQLGLARRALGKTSGLQI